MGECELIGGCPFFNGENDEEMKTKYCRNNNLNCARYMIFNSCGREHVPKDLAPNEKEKAYLVIAENG